MASDLLTEALVSDAVQHAPAHTAERFWQRVFARWFSTFIYNQIWEDPRADLAALKLEESSRILTISSGGCNVLNYLLAGPAHITAVDLNRNHLALLRLKLAAAKYLPRQDDFFAMFARADQTGNTARYMEFLRSHLDAATRRFWEGGSRIRRALFGPRLRFLEKNLYNYSQLGRLLRVLHAVARSMGRDLGRVLRAKNVEEQRRAFREEIAPVFDHILVRGALRLPFALFALGIPPQQATAFREDGASLHAELRARVERLACAFPISENYFAWQAFGRRYGLEEKRALPDYLRPENFATLRARVDRVETMQAGFRSFLRGQPAGAFDRFVLLDAVDWMPAPEIELLWREIRRVGGPGARIIFRTAGRVSPVESALPDSLRRQFYYDGAASAAGYAEDRSAIYGGFHVYRVEP